MNMHLKRSILHKALQCKFTALKLSTFFKIYLFIFVYSISSFVFRVQVAFKVNISKKIGSWIHTDFISFVKVGNTSKF